MLDKSTLLGISSDPLRLQKRFYKPLVGSSSILSPGTNQTSQQARCAHAARAFRSKVRAFILFYHNTRALGPRLRPSAFGVFDERPPLAVGLVDQHELNKDCVFEPSADAVRVKADTYYSACRSRRFH